MASERIEVVYKVVTPLFCGGADNDTAEVRLPSFKGVVRWWWRALAWSKLGEDLEKVRRAEDALFGSASGGQSKLVMRLISQQGNAKPTRAVPKGEILKLNNEVVGEGARYLGYGVMEAYDSEKKRVRKGQLLRACLEAPFELAIDLCVRGLGTEERELLFDALRAIGLLGGLGAKNRKGYGSLALRSLSIDGKPAWTPPGSLKTLQDAITKLLPVGSKTTELPPYTALSPRTRVVLLPASGWQEPLKLLDLVGREMMRYRSWGHRGHVLGSPTEGKFRVDHDLMKKAPRERHVHPRRIVFGLPHNYGKPSSDQVGPADKEDGDRRASPLLIHIHECGETSVAVLSFLPARFLSKGDTAKINVGGKLVPIAPERELWQPIDDLLRRFLSSDPEVRKEPFGQALEVRP